LALGAEIRLRGVISPPFTGHVPSFLPHYILLALLRLECLSLGGNIISDFLCSNVSAEYVLFSPFLFPESFSSLPGGFKRVVENFWENFRVNSGRLGKGQLTLFPFKGKGQKLGASLTLG